MKTETIYVVADTFNQLFAKVMFPLLGNEKAPNGGEHVFFVIDNIMYEWVNPGKVMMMEMPEDWMSQVTDIYSFQCTPDEKKKIIDAINSFHHSSIRYVRFTDYLNKLHMVPIGRAYSEGFEDMIECVAMTREILRQHFKLQNELPSLWSLRTAFLFDDFKTELTRIK